VCYEDVVQFSNDEEKTKDIHNVSIAGEHHGPASSECNHSIFRSG
jgi:hypothetical protein